MNLKNGIKLTLVSTAFGAFAFAALTATTPTISAAAKASEKYSRHCSKCHGADGRGDTTKGRQLDVPDLTKSNISDARSKRIITNGRDEMPGFGDKISDEDIAELVQYVKSFR